MNNAYKELLEALQKLLDKHPIEIDQQDYEEAMREYNRMKATAAIIGVSGALMVVALLIVWVS